MLATAELHEHLKGLGVNRLGIDLIVKVRSSPPVRSVKSSRSNVAIRFPSMKMGLTIQAESRNGEYPFVLAAETDDEILEFWDQPTTLKLTYPGPSGRRRGHRHTPDFLLIGERSVDFWECKPEKKLFEIQNRNKHLASLSEDGEWISPAGEKAGARFGIGYRYFTPSDADITLARNASFCLDYINQPLGDKEWAYIRQIDEIVKSCGAIRIDDLIQRVGSREPVFLAVAHNQVVFNWRQHLIAYPEAAFVYSSAARMSAHSRPVGSSSWRGSKPVLLHEGNNVLWDGAPWTVVNVGQKVALQNRDHKILNIGFKDVTDMLRSGDLLLESPQDDTEDDVYELVVSADEKDLATALERQKLLTRWRTEGVVSGVTERTLRNWETLEEKGLRIYGSAFLGLLPATKRRGNRGSRLSEQQELLLKLSFEEDYEAEAAPNWMAAFSKYLIRCRTAGCDSVSYQTYVTRGKERDQVAQIKKRQGRRASNQIDIPIADEDIDRLSMPTHGDRAWEVAHLDHTQIDEEVVSAITGENLGKPWLSILFDAFSRFVLAYWLSFESPSHRSVMAICRRCVEKWGRLPQRIVMDGGAEFYSTYTQALFARFAVEPAYRPSGQPRYGAPVERQFGGTDSRLIHNLRGNTKVRRLLRSMSSSHDPSGFAIWTPESLDNLMGEFLMEVYPRLPHLGIAEKPQARFERSVEMCGFRSFRFIASDQSFLISTMPEVTRKTRRIRKSSITINGLEYRGAGQSLLPFNGKDLPVRYDPYDISRAWVYAEGRWILVRCTHDLVRHYLERGIVVAQIEISARLAKVRKGYLSVEHVLLEFVENLTAKEKLLLSQREVSCSYTNAESGLDGLYVDSESRPASPLSVEYLGEDEGA